MTTSQVIRLGILFQSNMEGNNQEALQSEQAYEWVKANHHDLIKKFASGIKPVIDSQPISLFMAGSPGAGKTEFSKRLMAKFIDPPLRIDADEIRVICPGYLGNQAHLFQKAASKGVHLLYDYALRHRINIILDGTFAYNNALQNIQRSLSHQRKVEIFFIYQDPLQAWHFTKVRETQDCRKVSKDIFARLFFDSQKNVRAAKKLYSDQIELNLVIKDLTKGTERLELDIPSIDHFVQNEYTEGSLSRVLA